MVTKEKVLKAVEIIKTMAELIRELGEVPSGHLYGELCGVMSLEEYGKIIGILERTKLVQQRGHLLVWVGDK